MINQTKAVDKIRLIKKLGHLSEGLMDSVNQALKLHFAIEYSIFARLTHQPLSNKLF